MPGAGLYEVGPTKTYATIQGAFDQLWADQGAAAFTASQYIRVFAGTYDENVVPSLDFAPDMTNGYVLVLEGDPDVDRDSIILAPSGAANALLVKCDQILVRHMKIAGTPTTNMMKFDTGCTNPCVFDCNIITSGTASIWAAKTLQMSDCVVIVAADIYGIRVGNAAGELDIRRCKIIGPGKAGSTDSGIYSYKGHGPAHIEGCVISGFQDGVRCGVFSEEGSAYIVNNTFYDCNYGISNPAYTGFFQRTFINNIFEDVDYPYQVRIWPEETATKTGSIFVLRNNCFHGYTAFARDLSPATKTYAEWIALDLVDASGELDATDPLLTNPAGGDFSLDAASPCVNAGVGSGVPYDQLGTRFNPYFPNIGASAGFVGQPAGRQDAVRAALDTALAAYQVTDVAWENAEYVPTTGTLYLRPTFMPAEPEQAELGTTGRNRLVGIYQVDVFAPTGKGAGEAESKAEGIVTAFKRGRALASGGVIVRVEKAWRGPARQESDWYHVPVFIQWFAYAAN